MQNVFKYYPNEFSSTCFYCGENNAIAGISECAECYYFGLTIRADSFNSSFLYVKKMILSVNCSYRTSKHLSKLDCVDQEGMMLKLKQALRLRKLARLEFNFATPELFQEHIGKYL